MEHEQHLVLPGKYKLHVTTFGSSIPQFNNYLWPASGLIEVRVRPSRAP